LQDFLAQIYVVGENARYFGFEAADADRLGGIGSVEGGLEGVGVTEGGRGVNILGELAILPYEPSLYCTIVSASFLLNVNASPTYAHPPTR
jgi:hypothetical protein